MQFQRRRTARSRRRGRQRKIVGYGERKQIPTPDKRQQRVCAYALRPASARGARKDIARAGVVPADYLGAVFGVGCIHLLCAGRGGSPATDFGRGGGTLHCGRRIFADTDSAISVSQTDCSQSHCGAVERYYVSRTNRIET